MYFKLRNLDFKTLKVNKTLLKLHVVVVEFRCRLLWNLEFEFTNFKICEVEYNCLYGRELSNIKALYTWKAQQSAPPPPIKKVFTFHDFRRHVQTDSVTDPVRTVWVSWIWFRVAETQLKSVNYFFFFLCWYFFFFFQF